MRRVLRGVLVVMCAAVPMLASAGTSVGVSVGIAEGPNTIRLSFRSAPAVVRVRECDVDVVDDARCPDDVFCYAGTWWVLRDARWYRAHDWHGPFVRVRDRAVPAALWRVPERHWKHDPHGLPPELARRPGERIEHGHGRDRGAWDHGHADDREGARDHGR